MQSLASCALDRLGQKYGKIQRTDFPDRYMVSLGHEVEWGVTAWDIELIAVDQDTGRILWQFQTPSGIIGQPVTWQRNGRQYVTVTSGIGGVYAMRTPDPNLAHVPPGGTLLTFALFDQ